MKIRSLNKQEIQVLFDRMESSWPKEAIPKKPKTLRIAEIENGTSLIVNDEILAVTKNNDVIPYLGSQERLRLFPKVTVDSGAVKFICNGADVMRPGVRSSEGTFERGNYVVVREEAHGKFLVVGKAMTNSETVKGMAKGAIIENLHHVGDTAWNTGKSMKGPF